MALWGFSIKECETGPISSFSRACVSVWFGGGFIKKEEFCSYLGMFWKQRLLYSSSSLLILSQRQQEQNKSKVLRTKEKQQLLISPEGDVWSLGGLG